MKPRIAIPQARSNSPEYLARVMPQYCGAVQFAGGEPVEISLELDSAEIARLAASCDGVLLPGSRADINPERYGQAVRDPHTAEDDPLRDNADELLLQDAYNMRKPILGICFGLQSLNVWRTGTLRQHLMTSVTHSGNSQDPAPPHRAIVDATSRLGAIVRDAVEQTTLSNYFPAAICHPGAERTEGNETALIEVMVNTSHHQAVLKPGDGLKAVAWCPDDNVIEAVEGTDPDHWVIAVQWHPERMTDDPVASALFSALVDAARDRHEHPRADNPDFESVGQ